MQRKKRTHPYHIFVLVLWDENTTKETIYIFARFFFNIIFIYLFILVMLGLCCCAWASSSGEEELCSRCSARASQYSGFSPCRAQVLDSWASVLAAWGLSSRVHKLSYSMWSHPRPGIKPCLLH